MTHPLVDQFRFARSEWRRGLEGVSEAEGARHFAAMNCISWIVGHLAWHEQRTFLTRPRGLTPYPLLNVVYAYGAPMATPSLAETLAIWQPVTAAAEPYLNGLGAAELAADLPDNGAVTGQSRGSALLRITYHYWFHTGEIQAIRQLLGHTGLPEYVGDIEVEAPYRNG
jgi:hypothetical protein